MMYKFRYKTPKGLSNIIMHSDGKYLTRLWFEGSKDSYKHEIDCQEVVGSTGSLTGYGGGIKNKIALLQLEKNDMRKFFIPKQGTAL